MLGTQQLTLEGVDKEREEIIHEQTNEYSVCQGQTDSGRSN